MPNDSLKTSPVAPPSIALAMMAFKLAQLRVWGAEILARPIRRADICDEAPTASIEYYHILRRIEDGETP